MDNPKLPSGDTWYTQENTYGDESHLPVDHRGDAKVTAHVYVENDNTLNEEKNRINQQQVIPSAIKNRLMLLVSDSGTSGIIGTTFNTGTSVIATAITTNASKGFVMNQVYWQIYIGAVNASSRMPEAISSSNYPFYTWNSLYNTDSRQNIISSIAPSNQMGASALTNQSISRIQVRNNSGSTQTIYLEVYIRMITNGSGASTGSG